MKKVKKLQEVTEQLPDKSTEFEMKRAISVRVANKINMINEIIGGLNDDEIAVLNETIQHINDELVQVEGFQSMFNPAAAQAKAKNRRQGIRRMELMKEWKELMNTAVTSSIEQAVAIKDMEALSGLGM